jgi:fission 1 protein
MRTSKQQQREIKSSLDEKLSLSTPQPSLLESLALECSSSPDATFQYAFALSKSSSPSELSYSITLLDSLLKSGYPHQIDCMIGSCQAHYLLKQYAEARSVAEAILRNNPQNALAGELHVASMVAMEEEEERKVRNVAIGGTAAVAALGLALLLGSGGKKR